MNSIATNPRNIILINIRKNSEKLYLKARNLVAFIKNANQPRRVDSFVLYPPITDEITLADIINRLSWYLPTGEHAAAKGIKVVVPVSDNLKYTLIKSLKTPAGQARYMNEDLNHIKIEYYKNVIYDDFKRILLWDSKKVFSKNVLFNLDRVGIVDPEFYLAHESVEYTGLYYQTLNIKYMKDMEVLSENNFNRLMDSISYCKTAWTFATGPSIEMAYNFDYSQSVNIICNSMVKNEKLLEHIKPNILFFADPYFHFSPCLYSHEFRKFMLDTVTKYRCYVFIPKQLVPLYLDHYPQLADKIIGMDIKDKFMPPTYSHRLGSEHKSSYHSLRFSAFDNILRPMIEFASFVVNDVYIIGADGRNTKENYFWKHNNTTQFTDIMETVFNTHPSFFRDKIYTDYYENHCEKLKELILYGENKGIKYHSVTKSYIPILRKRFEKLQHMKGRVRE